MFEGPLWPRFVSEPLHASDLSEGRGNGMDQALSPLTLWSEVWGAEVCLPACYVPENDISDISQMMQIISLHWEQDARPPPPSYFLGHRVHHPNIAGGLQHPLQPMYKALYIIMANEASRC